MISMNQNYDVVVLGGGLAGFDTRVACSQAGANRKHRDPGKERSPGPPRPRSKSVSRPLKSPPTISARSLSSKNISRASNCPNSDYASSGEQVTTPAFESRLELGGTIFPPTPSYQLDRGRFENYLAQLCQQRDITFIDRCRVSDVDVRRGRGSHCVTFERDQQKTELQARWLVDASGRAGILKRRLSLEKESPHKANATWFRVENRIKVDDWSDCEQWCEPYDEERARWYSTNHLMGEGYWVWLIPLASGSTSIGIVADEKIHPLSTFNSLEKSLAWLDKHEPQCAASIRDTGGEIQDFLAIKNYSLECQRVFSADRWGIVGEAGFFLDPFYSPGSDFIAFSNMFLTDLIQRDLNGKGIRFRSFLYDRIFKRFFHGTAHVYNQQYPLFGNQQVMPVKILWDYICVLVVDRSHRFA